MNTIFPGNNQWVQPGYSIVGTCSICGGAVTVPTIWGGVVPPVPSCTACGAVKKQSYGPVIEMVPRSVTIGGGNVKFGYSTSVPKQEDYKLNNPKFTKDT